MIDGVRVCAIIPAAGSGTRMGTASATSKALIPLGGVPVIIRTLARFQESAGVDDVVITLRPPEIDDVRGLAAGAGITKVREIIAGGAERQESVRLGFSTGTARRAGLIVVHDAVRPLVTVDLIDRVIKAALMDGAAVAAVRPRDTVKIQEEQGLVTPDRTRCWLAQTPQAFRRDLFVRAIETARKDGFEGTDDVSLIERIGHPVSIVEGSYENLKITTRGDIRVAELLSGGGIQDHTRY
jgi:2-C-methyl-D-erythritol 4-phosphate cytidylyltransferase